MAYSVSSIPASHRKFADAVCTNLLREQAYVPGLVEVFADGTNSPNGERYVALRRECSFDVRFDFNEGKVHRVWVELPDECGG